MITGHCSRPVLVMLWLVSGLLSQLSHGRGIDYESRDNPTLHRCDVMHWQGELDPAQDCFRQITGNPENPLVDAEASWALGDVKRANNLFRKAQNADPENPRIRLRWGELFAETHQYDEALKLFDEALVLNPDYAPAKIATAEILAQRFEGKAKEIAQEVAERQTSPSATLRSNLLLARIALEEGNLIQADVRLEKASAIVDTEDLPKLQVLALRSALAALREENSATWTNQALALNPHYGDIYAVPAYFYVITRRYREAVQLYKQAVAIQPDLWPAHVELGSNLMRINRVNEGRKHLQIAYGGDPYDPRTVNLLRLLDTFKDFDTFTYPEEIPESGVPSLVTRLNREESELLNPYVRRLAQEAIESMSRRYDFELQEPVILELYPNHDDFTVRTVGMPGLGILGATFGYLVAMDSPSGRPTSDFHWGTTLWHEMAHVFTLEMTHHRVPRWFSEGISVFEEWRAGPIPNVLVPRDFLEALKQELLLPIAELDRGFLRPSYPSQIIVSYMQAGMICLYIDERYGFDTLLVMLTEFGDGATTVEAVETATEISHQEFDTGFMSFISEYFLETLAGLEIFDKTQQDIRKAMQNSDWDSVIELSARAIELNARHVTENSPYLSAARAHEELGQSEGVLGMLRAYFDQGGRDHNVLQTLSQALRSAGEHQDAVRVLDAVNLIQPFDRESHAQLGDWLMEDGNPDAAIVEYQAVLALDPHDVAMAHFQLASAYAALNDDARTRKHLLQSLEAAPSFKPAQRLLLKISRN